MPDRVKIFDTTLRDGEQSPGINLSPKEKFEIALQLAHLCDQVCLGKSWMKVSLPIQ